MKINNSVYRYGIACLSSVLLLASLIMPFNSVYAKSNKTTATQVAGEQIKSDVKTSYPLNINKADANALSTIPGIGKSRAEAIVAYRDENGLFKTTENLAEVRGISSNFVEKHKDYITVE